MSCEGKTRAWRGKPSLMKTQEAGKKAGKGL
jgi:hypothetical protein